MSSTVAGINSAYFAIIAVAITRAAATYRCINATLGCVARIGCTGIAIAAAYGSIAANMSPAVARIASACVAIITLAVGSAAR